MILINPRSTKFGIFEKYVPLSVPIGIGYLTGYLVSKTKTVRIIDEQITPISKELLEDITKQLSRPYIFGISTLTPSVKRSYELAHFFKEWFPDSKIILGGIHPTVLPGEVLKNPDIDFVVRREGEEVMLELYDALKNNDDYRKIRGLSFRHGTETVHNPDAELPDLNKLPSFPYHLFENLRTRYNFGFILSSRGCPFNCIFCSQRAVSGQRYRYMPTPVVIEEIDALIKRYGQTHINFVDDNFTANKQRIVQLCEAMINKEFYKKATFDCQTRADAVNDEIFILLKRAGFRVINFGLETASERLMVILNKRETVKQNIDAVKLAKKHGFGVSGTFIFGLPTETREERQQAYQMANELKLDYVRFNNATPYPGTRLYEIAKSENRLFIEENWTNLNACGSLVQDSATGARLPYVPATCDEDTLKRDVIKANLFFSLRVNKVFGLLIKRVGPAGWFYLPKRWYLKPSEWFCLIKLSLRLLSALMGVYKDQLKAILFKTG